jgi:hypothetical protein
MKIVMTLTLTTILDWAIIAFTTFMLGSSVQLAVYYGHIWTAMFNVWVFWELFNLYLVWRLNQD